MRHLLFITGNISLGQLFKGYMRSIIGIQKRVIKIVYYSTGTKQKSWPLITSQYLSMVKTKNRLRYNQLKFSFERNPTAHKFNLPCKSSNDYSIAPR